MTKEGLKSYLLHALERSRDAQHVKAKELQDYYAGKETAYLDVLAMLGYHAFGETEESEA